MEHHICITKKVCNFTRLSKADILNLHHAIKIHVLSLQKKKRKCKKTVCSCEPIYLHGLIYCVIQNIYNNVCVCLLVLQTNRSTGRPKVKDTCFPWLCLPGQGHIPQKSHTATDSQFDCGVLSILFISINSTLNVLNVKKKCLPKIKTN